MIITLFRIINKICCLYFLISIFCSCREKETFESEKNIRKYISFDTVAYQRTIVGDWINYAESANGDSVKFKTPYTFSFYKDGKCEVHSNLDELRTFEWWFSGQMLITRDTVFDITKFLPDSSYVFFKMKMVN